MLGPMIDKIERRRFGGLFLTLLWFAFWALVAWFFPASPALAARVWMEGFEHCTFDAGVCWNGSSGNGAACNDSGDCAGGGSCGHPIYTADSVISSTSDTGPVLARVTSSSPTPRNRFCNSNSGDDRGLACTTNSDCDNAEPSGACVGVASSNVCSLELTPTTGGEAIVKSFPTEGVPAYAHFLLNVSTVGASGDVSLVTMKQGSAKGCFAVAERVDASSYIVRTYFESQGYECAGGTNDGTECTLDAQCTSRTPGETLCTSSFTGQTPVLQAGRWYEFVLGEEVSGQAARCTLWEGGFNRGEQTRPQGTCTVDGFACGTNSDCVSPRCSPWSVGDDPKGTITCATNGDCTGADVCAANTCTGSAVSNVTSIVFGPETAPTSSTWKLNFDDIVIDDASDSNITNLRLPVLYPNSDAAVLDGGWLGRSGGTADRYTYIDDPAGALNTADYLDRNGNPNSDAYGLTTFSLAAGESVAAGASVAMAGLWQDNSDGTSGKRMALCAHDGVSTRSCWGTCSTNSDCTKYLSADVCSGGICYQDIASDIPGGGDYFPHTYALITDPPGAPTAWCVGGSGCTGKFDLDNLAMEVKTASSGAFRLAAAYAQVEVAMAAPALPGIAVDVNGDGVKRVTIAGDSTANDAAFHQLLAGSLEDFDSIIECARGSSMLADDEDELDDILDGTVTGGELPCKTVRGDLGKADYLVLLSGVNTLHQNAQAPEHWCNGGTNAGKPCSPGLCTASVCVRGEVGTACATNADCMPDPAGTCPGGTCEMYTHGYCRGGTDHGDPCFCPQNSRRLLADWEDLCINNASGRWLSTTNTDTQCRSCATSADCDTKISCATNSDCFEILSTDSECNGGLGRCVVPCSGGACSARVYSNFARRVDYAQPGATWIHGGCTGASGCSGGFCAAGNSMAEVLRSWEAIAAGVAARGAGDEAELVVVTQPGPIDTIDVACSTNADCAQGVPCTSSICTYSSLSIVFASHRRRAAQAAGMVRHWADKSGLKFVDLDGWFRHKCEDATWGQRREVCYRDAIHFNFDNEVGGVAEATRALEACFENKDGTADGICTASECTGGRIGRSCSDNADCDLYRCDLTP